MYDPSSQQGDFMSVMKSLALSILVSTSVLIPKTSSAGVGFPLSSPLIITAGIATIAGGGTAGFFGVKQFKKGDGVSGTLLSLASLGMIGMGLLFLDSEQSLAFKEISSLDALELGVSSEEASIYNSELDQVNALASEVSEELSQIKKPTVGDSSKAWMSVKEYLSPETIRVMGKIVSR